MKIILLFVFFSLTFFSFSQTIDEKMDFTFEAIKRGDKNDVFKYENDIINYQKKTGIDSNYLNLLQFYADQCYSFYENDKSIDYQLEICELSKNIYGKNSFKYLECINILSILYNETRQLTNEIESRIKYKNIIRYIYTKYSEEYFNSLIPLSVIYNSQGNFQSTLEVDLEKLNIASQIFDKRNPNYLLNLQLVAIDYFNISDYEKSKLFYEKALDVHSLNNDYSSDSYFNTISGFALVFRNLGEHEKSKALNLECLKKREILLGKDHPNYLISLNNLAMDYSLLGDIDKSLELKYECLSLTEKLYKKESQEYINCIDNLIIDYLSIGNLNKVIEFRSEKLKWYELFRGIEHPDYLISLSNLAGNYSSLGDYNKSLELNTECLRLAELVLGKEHPNYLISLNNLAVNYSDIGGYNKSLELNLECLRIKKNVLGKEHLGYLITLSNLAGNYSDLGDYNKSLELNTECLRLAELVLGKEHPNYLISLNNLAVNYSDIGGYNKSLELNLECLRIKKNVLGKEHLGYLITLSNLAGNYSDLGDYQKSIELNLECLRLREKLLGKDHPDYFLSLNNLAITYLDLGDYNKSLELNQECLRLVELVLGKEHPNYPAFINNVGLHYYYLKDYNKSLEFNYKSLRITELVLGKEHPDYFNSLKGLALCYLALDKLSFSDSLLNLSVELQNNYLQDNLSGLNERLKLDFKSNINSFNEYFTNYSIFRKQENSKLLEHSFKTWLNLNGIISNQTTQLQEQVYASQDTSLINLYEDWKLNKLQLMKYYELTIPEREERGLDLKAYESIIEQQEQELSRLSDVFSDMKKEYSIEDIKMNLKDDEVYIDIIALPYFNFQTNSWKDTIQYLAYIINNKVGESPATVLLENGNQLEGELFMNYANSAYGYNKNQQSPDALSYNYFWKPIAEEIKGKPKVYVSLGGVFNKLNLETLYNPSSNNYLIDELDIEMVNNGRSFIQNKIKGPKNYENFTATLVGFPNYNGGQDSKDSSESDLYAYSNLRDIPSNIIDSLSRGGFNISSLPGTKIEVESISEILKTKDWKVDVLMEDEATEYAVKEVISPRVLHIATHGYFFKEKEIARNNDLKFFGMEKQKVIENPLLRSGLLLAGANSTIKGEETNVKENGILTAYEASYLNLKETELVVLSACETGRGDVQNGEGVYGLRKSISDAGAQNIIMSLWKVDDKVTQEFMSTFYENWLSGLTIREAFIKTQHFIKDKYPQPYYWGAFVLIGE